MSCSWDIYCLDCGMGAGWDWNHGDDALGDILRSVREIAAAMPVLDKLYDAGNLNIRIGHGCEGGDMNSIRFLAEHATHKLALRDEYGQFLDDCSERIKCCSCEETFVCRRKSGHKGKHSPKRDYDPSKR